MGKNYVLYNPFADNGKGELNSRKVKEYLKGEIEFTDMSKVSNYQDLFRKFAPDDRLIICGGDGTLIRFVNACDDMIPDNEVYLFPVGTGNDFLLDIGYKDGKGPVLINKFLSDLPWVEVKGKKYYFIDNVACGIDGWVCEIADQKKGRNPGANINYTTIAISGLLGKYKPCNARVTVDGQTMDYRRVWMAPSMNGRYFGGGMMVTPYQDRLSADRTLTLMMFTGSNRLKTAVTFPQIFSGKHVNSPHTVFVKGHDIVVEFDEPRAVQIDGETILGVTRYHAVKI